MAAILIMEHTKTPKIYTGIRLPQLKAKYQWSIKFDEDLSSLYVQLTLTFNLLDINSRRQYIKTFSYFPKKQMI